VVINVIISFVLNRGTVLETEDRHTAATNKKGHDINGRQIVIPPSYACEQYSNCSIVNVND
jgi:hypothetical protein